jgi:hypothetical protein
MFKYNKFTYTFRNYFLCFQNQDGIGFIGHWKPLNQQHYLQTLQAIRCNRRKWT